MAGTVNDKSIVRFDKTVQAVREGKPYRSMAYKLRDKDDVEQVEKGLYLIVDGEYLRWRSLVGLAKEVAAREEVAWIKRLESVRKDVECFFGILKGRFRILKLPILFGESAQVDNVVWTCCILHNMLHSFDGLKLHESDMDWAGPDGLLDAWLHEDRTMNFGTNGRNSNGPPERVEVEDGFFAMRRRLVMHYTYRVENNEVAWLRSQSGQK